MFLHATTPAWSEIVAVASKARPRASTHVQLASGSVIQGTGTFSPGYQSRPLSLDEQRRRDEEEEGKAKLR